MFCVFSLIADDNLELEGFGINICLFPSKSNNFWLNFCDLETIWVLNVDWPTERGLSALHTWNWNIFSDFDRESGN